MIMTRSMIIAMLDVLQADRNFTFDHCLFLFPMFYRSKLGMHDLKLTIKINV